MVVSMTSSFVVGDIVVAGAVVVIVLVVTSRVVVVGAGSVTTVVTRRVVGALVGMVVTSGVWAVGGAVVSSTAGEKKSCNVKVLHNHSTGCIPFGMQCKLVETTRFQLTDQSIVFLIMYVIGKLLQTKPQPPLSTTHLFLQ